MICPGCTAQLATGTPTCRFCGTSLANQHSLAAWAAPPPANEAWRVWSSFFSGGIYGPWAAGYLLAVERHNRSLGFGRTAPTPPSARPLALVSMFVGVPVLLSAFFGFLVAVMSAGEEARQWLFVNVFATWFYVLSLVIARVYARQGQSLVAAVSGGDPEALAAYRRGAIGRGVATVAALLPFATVICAGVSIALWSRPPDWVGAAYALSMTGAAFGTSWLQLDVVQRVRQSIAISA